MSVYCHGCHSTSLLLGPFQHITITGDRVVSGTRPNAFHGSFLFLSPIVILGEAGPTFYLSNLKGMCDLLKAT